MKSSVLKAAIGLLGLPVQFELEHLGKQLTMHLNGKLWRTALHHSKDHGSYRLLPMIP
jgi:hypothetical protein